jgi:hypothetical protein
VDPLINDRCECCQQNKGRQDGNAMVSLSLQQSGAWVTGYVLLVLNAGERGFQILGGCRARQLYRPNETIPTLGNGLDISRSGGRVEQCRPQALNDGVESLFKFNVRAIRPETTR